MADPEPGVPPWRELCDVRRKRLVVDRGDVGQAWTMRYVLFALLAALAVGVAAALAGPHATLAAVWRAVLAGRARRRRPGAAPPAPAAPPPAPSAGSPHLDPPCWSPTPAPVDADAQFSVYRPVELVAEEWAPVAVFAHTSEPYEDARHEVVEPIRQVEVRARALFDGAPSRSTRVDAAGPIRRGATLRFALELAGATCNPPVVTVDWWEPVQEATFRVRADAAMAGRRVAGHARVWCGPLLLAQTALSIPVVAAAAVVARSAATADPASGTAAAPPPVPGRTWTAMTRYRKIFPSYSHSDGAVVHQFRAVAEALGDRYLQDVLALRAGERWSPRLMALIDEADVFQLFWSSNSMRSPHCRREWEHALGLGREGFVRPLHWEQPLPEDQALGLPPDELRRLHFAAVDREILAAPAPPWTVTGPPPAPSAPPGYPPPAASYGRQQPRPTAARPAGDVSAVEEMRAGKSRAGSRLLAGAALILVVLALALAVARLLQS